MRTRYAVAALTIALLVTTITASAASAAVTLPPGSITPPTSGSFLYLNSENGDWIGQGQEQLFTSSNATLGGALRDNTFGGAAYVSAGAWGVTVAAPAGHALTVGSYEGAVRPSSLATAVPQLEVTAPGRACNSLSGRFDVTQVAFSSLGEITLFEATFEQHCEGLAPALYGRIRIESPAPTPGSTLPPGSMSVPTSGTFLYLVKTNTATGTYEQLYTTADSTFDWSYPYSNNNQFHVSVVQGSYTHFWSLDIAAPQGSDLVRGHYDGAIRIVSRTATPTPGLDLTGDGQGCNEVHGSFDVDEFTFAWDWEVSVFQATFHFYCDNSLVLQHGRVRIEHATPPAPPFPTLGLTIDSKGKATDASGYATVSGSMSCSRSVSLYLNGKLVQVKPDHTTINGSFAGNVDCIAPSSRWTLPAGGTNDFTSSGASATADLIYCDGRGCVSASASQTVKFNQGK